MYMYVLLGFTISKISALLQHNGCEWNVVCGPPKHFKVIFQKYTVFILTIYAIEGISENFSHTHLKTFASKTKTCCTVESHLK